MSGTESILGGRSPEHLACEFSDGRAGRWHPVCVECPFFDEHSSVPEPCRAYFARPSYRPRRSEAYAIRDLIVPEGEEMT